MARAELDGDQMMIDINNLSHPFIWTSKNGSDVSLPIYGHAGLSDDFLRRGAINFSGVISSVIEEATYCRSNTDGTDSLFDGPMVYTLKFPRGGLPAVSGFLSVTMYNTSTAHTFNLVSNPIHRYSIRDGSLTFYIQSASLGKGKESNWLPAPPAGQFTQAFEPISLVGNSFHSAGFRRRSFRFRR